MYHFNHFFVLYRNLLCELDFDFSLTLWINDFNMFVTSLNSVKYLRQKLAIKIETEFFNIGVFVVRYYKIICISREHRCWATNQTWPTILLNVHLRRKKKQLGCVVLSSGQWTILRIETYSISYFRLKWGRKGCALKSRFWFKAFSSVLGWVEILPESFSVCFYILKDWRILKYIHSCFRLYSITERSELVSKKKSTECSNSGD